MPANSPYLNPIENVFSIMKRHVRNNCPTTEKGLREAIHEAWDLIDTQTLRNLFNSMPGRMQEVIEHEGDRIAY